MKNNSSVKKKTVFLFAAVIALMLFIFMFSSQNGEESSHLSLKVSKIFAKILFFNYGSMSDSEQVFIVTELNFFVRKLAHFTVYTALGMLVYSTLLSFGGRLKHKRIFALGICALYAAIDEIHQYFIPARSMRFRDVIIDSAGAFFGIIIVSVIIIIYMYIKDYFGKSDK